MLRLIEKDFDTANDWRNVEGAPLFATYDEVRDWLTINSYEYTDHLRVIETTE